MNLKRKWVYTQPPSDYDMSPCKCGNEDTQWSEFQGRLWCSKCNLDFIPESNGVFDGPIPIEVSRLMGIEFNRYNLETKLIEENLNEQVK